MTGPGGAAGGQQIAFTSHDASDDPINSTSAEIYLLDPSGSGGPERLTNNFEEERSPDWSPDGTRIAFACWRGGPDFEICVMDADGTNQSQLTNSVGINLFANWGELRVHDTTASSSRNGW